MFDSQLTIQNRVLDEETLHVIAEIVFQYSLSRHEKPFFIAVCGGTSTCKTSQVASRLQTLFGETECELIELDNFQKGRESKHLFTSPHGHDNPDYFEVDEASLSLSVLAEGKEVSIPVYDYLQGIPVGVRQVEPKPIVIYEGLFAATRGLADLADLIVYVESPCYARMLRRLFRNQFERYSIDPSITLKGFFSTLRGHQEWIVPQKEKAFFTIKTDYYFEDSLQCFPLQPLFSELIISAYALCFHLDPETRLIAYQKSDAYYVDLSHKGFVYLHMNVNAIDFQRVVDIDWAAC